MRFPEFQGEWEEKKLGEVAEIIGGGTPDTTIEKYWNGEIQWFTPSEIKSAYVDKSERTITELGLVKSSAKLLPAGAVLITTRATIGEVAIAQKECCTNQGFQSLVVNDGINNIFIANWIKQNKNELTKRAKGSTFAEISKSEVEKIPLVIPNTDEQNKIAKFLSLLDERISTQNKIIEQYKSLIKGLNERLFSRKIRFKEFSEIWELTALEEVLIKNSTKNKNQKYSIVQSVSNKYGFINQDEIFEDRRVASINISNYYVIDKGCFAYNPSRIDIGSL
ncbi:MAG: restriction endonuclease subunit S, partial [Dysgonamonadaceae bacterium]|nr:restriction endonuclease subunit S [Dysgonamonadaceae bacterium]